ncbi:PhzF family phenazine biosynthesis protein [Edaphovirga cremea]|uniref:PhzF family phenazine biosynthesis protein n=1 Tax=Edaphovirga cremea TaxID=2267246 RepID=UPI00398A3246
MTMRYFQVAAFVGEGLAGNPAGVCLLEKPLETRQLQGIAAELNLPETCFVWEEGEMLALRWFTPGREVDLCGHATLAAARVIFSEVSPERNELCFRSASGVVRVTRQDSDRDKLWLDFPSRPAVRIDSPAGFSALLGIKPQEVWQAKALMAVLENERQVRELQPAIAALINHVGQGVIVTAPGDRVDFVSRYFSLDRSEDPVTGSAHCTLMPYWQSRLGRDSAVAHQISARGGELFCQQQGERTLIGGYARLFLRGEILI